MKPQKYCPRCGNKLKFLWMYDNECKTCSFLFRFDYFKTVTGPGVASANLDYVDGVLRSNHNFYWYLTKKYCEYFDGYKYIELPFLPFNITSDRVKQLITFL